ncbi:hypothetical protein, partial [Ruminococcus sp.]|uniref:hypothetical protein n=1 Tax=Ruminococcus sp. TaxID=41978 RepID=UPI003867AB67
TERTSAGTSKSPKTAFIPFDASDSISQSLKNVNIKNSENSKNKKYAVDYTIQDEKYDNLESLDDEGIRVYNKRGWANGLFNREDMKLLNEKYSELDRRLNSRTDNMLADGTRIVEVNNKIVMIGGTYNDPAIYGVFLINAENETYAEYVKEETLGYVNKQRNYSRRKYEGIWETAPLVYGEENVRYYNAYDYSYQKGRDDTGIRATLPGNFSRYGYNKESNIRGRSNEKAQGEVSSVLLDEDTSDIKYATDDTIQGKRRDFRKALSREEWASFYALLEKNNQRNAFRIGDNGILIPINNKFHMYKLVCYESIGNNPVIRNIYFIENYDYNIHDKTSNPIEVLMKCERNGCNEKYIRTILQHYSEVFGSVFKRYNRNSGRFIKLT